MKIFISYPITNNPFGGGNQFIKILAAKLTSRNLLADSPMSAQLILTNGFYSPPSLNSYDWLFNLKRKNPMLKILHRVDGIFAIMRNPKYLYLDKIVNLWAKICIDGAIFQTAYCQNIQYQYGYPQNIPATIIGNACDSSIFHPPVKKFSAPDGRIRLIYTSWSNNMLKGFPTLKMLDKALDFTRYSFTFVGNSPVKFENIVHIPARPSEKLADLLREADIFVGLSHIEACSNAIGEALACGVPVLIRNTGGNPSFVSQGAVLYDRDEDIIPALECMAADPGAYRARLRPLDMEEVTNQYVSFAEELVAHTPSRRPDCRQFLALRKTLRAHYPELPSRWPWRAKLWLESLWS